MIPDENDEDLVEKSRDGVAPLDLHQPVQDVGEQVRSHHRHLIDEEDLRLLKDVPHDVRLSELSDEALAGYDEIVVHRGGRTAETAGSCTGGRGQKHLLPQDGSEVMS